MDTWVSPVPASVAAPLGLDETPVPVSPDGRSAARAIAEPSVRVIAGKAGRADADDTDSCRAFAVGALLDARYRIVRFVGRGGMGEVYEAHDQLMDRRVALKTILPSVTDRARAARRFKAEVRNAQRVAHPHVCRIHDLHEHHDADASPLPFFTMELIDGERLAQQLNGAALPLEDTRRIALQLLGGLAAAHARGVLHLDFKSDNVMLRRGTSAPEAAIMDFGLSRAHGDSGGLLTSDRRQFAGTLPYMSIEQLECRESLGPATDVYAFGVVLYEMLTGALPFEGESLGTLLMKQLNERPVPPSRRAPGLSHAVDRFVLRCLDREPRERFSDAGAALAALSAIGDWSGPGAAFARWRSLWPAAALLVAGGVLLSKRSAVPPAPPERHDLAQVTTRLGPRPPAARRAPAHDDVHRAVAPTGTAARVAASPETARPADGLARSDGSGEAMTTSEAAAIVRGAVVTAAALVTQSVVSPPATSTQPDADARTLPSEAASAARALDGSPSPSTPPGAAPAPAPPPLAPAPDAVTVEPQLEPSASAAASWTPTRVPKRLSTLGSAQTHPTPPGPTPAAPATMPPSPSSDAQNRPR